MIKVFTLILCFGLKSVFGLYPSSSDVVDLTPANFERLVKQSDSVWVVEFYAPWCGHCKNLVPEYSKAATALKGVIKLGAINADEHQTLAQEFKVQGFPTIKIFGQNKDTPEDYNGGRTAADIVDAALKAARSKVDAQIGRKSSKSSSGSSDVVTLTDDNFNSLVLDSEDVWLVEFYAPWCGHCKNLEPHWAKAATELKGKVKLGALDSTVHTAKAAEYGVKGYPTIKVFGAGKKTRNSAEDYNGGRTASDIVQFALDLHSEAVEAPEIVQIVNEDTVKQCGEKTLCVVSVLPHILDCDANCRNSYISTLVKLGDKYKKKLWGWVWSEAGSQPELENILEIGGFGYPAMAVVSVKKMKYSLLRGSFSEQGINEFLRDLSFGRGQTAPVKGGKIPKIDSIEPWDGKDGELPTEEDIDLSDVELEKDEL